MCQPHLNTLKTSVRNARCSIPICTTYQTTILHCWNKIQSFLHGETAVSHGHCEWHGFEFFPPEELWQKLPNIHQKFTTTPQVHAINANHLGVPPHALHIFHVHLHDVPHLVSHHPHETALHTPPHGTCMKLLSNCSTSLQDLCTQPFGSLP